MKSGARWRLLRASAKAEFATELAKYAAEAAADKAFAAATTTKVGEDSTATAVGEKGEPGDDSTG